jgi:hypothetical protein
MSSLKMLFCGGLSVKKMIRIPFLGSEVYGIVGCMSINDRPMILWVSLVRPKWKAREVKEMGISKAALGLLAEK